MMRVVLLASALLLVPGCLDAGALARFVGPEEYRLVLVEATYAHDAAGPGVCGFDSLPEIDEDSRSIVFHNERPPADARVLVLAIVWSAAGCGTGSAHWATLDEDTGLARLELPGLGVVGVAFDEDGSVRVDDATLPPGGLTVEARGEGWSVSASFRDAGAWPAAGVSLA